MTSFDPAAMSESTAQAMSGLLSSGTIGLGSVYVTGRKRVPNPAARIMDLMVVEQTFLSAGTEQTRMSALHSWQLLRRKDHVLRQVGARAAVLPVQIGIGLAQAVIHAHPQLLGHRANHVHRSLDLEVF